MIVNAYGMSAAADSAEGALFAPRSYRLIRDFVVFLVQSGISRGRALERVRGFSEYRELHDITDDYPSAKTKLDTLINEVYDSMGKP